MQTRQIGVDRIRTAFDARLLTTIILKPYSLQRQPTASVGTLNLTFWRRTFFFPNFSTPVFKM